MKKLYRVCFIDKLQYTKTLIGKLTELYVGYMAWIYDRILEYQNVSKISKYQN